MKNKETTEFRIMQQYFLMNEDLKQFQAWLESENIAHKSLGANALSKNDDLLLYAIRYSAAEIYQLLLPYYNLTAIHVNEQNVIQYILKHIIIPDKVQRTFIDIMNALSWDELYQLISEGQTYDSVLSHFLSRYRFDYESAREFLDVLCQFIQDKCTNRAYRINLYGEILNRLMQIRVQHVGFYLLKCITKYPEMKQLYMQALKVDTEAKLIAEWKKKYYDTQPKQEILFQHLFKEQAFMVLAFLNQNKQLDITPLVELLNALYQCDEKALSALLEGPNQIISKTLVDNMDALEFVLVNYIRHSKQISLIPNQISRLLEQKDIMKLQNNLIVYFLKDRRLFGILEHILSHNISQYINQDLFHAFRKMGLDVKDLAEYPAIHSIIKLDEYIVTIKLHAHKFGIKGDGQLSNQYFKNGGIFNQYAYKELTPQLSVFNSTQEYQLALKQAYRLLTQALPGSNHTEHSLNTIVQKSFDPIQHDIHFIYYASNVPSIPDYNNFAAFISTANHAQAIMISEGYIYFINRGIGVPTSRRFVSTKHDTGIHIYQLTSSDEKLIQETLVQGMEQDVCQWVEHFRNKIGFTNVHAYLPMKSQKMGNCCWATSKALILAMLLKDLFNDTNLKIPAMARKRIEQRFQSLFPIVLTMYKAFTRFDRLRGFQRMIGMLENPEFDNIPGLKEWMMLNAYEAIYKFLHYLHPRQFQFDAKFSSSDQTRMISGYFREKNYNIKVVHEMIGRLLTPDFIRLIIQIDIRNIGGMKNYKILLNEMKDELRILQAKNLCYERMTELETNIDDRLRIMDACQQKSTQKLLAIIKYLVQNFPQFSKPLPNGDTLLHLACQNRHIPKGVLVYLRKTFAQTMLNARNVVGKTPLHIACELGNFNMVRILMKRRFNCRAFALPDRGLRDAYGNTPLHLALKGGYFQLAKFMLSKTYWRISDAMACNVENELGHTPLYHALVATADDAKLDQETLRMLQHLGKISGELEFQKYQQLFAMDVSLTAAQRETLSIRLVECCPQVRMPAAVKLNLPAFAVASTQPPAIAGPEMPSVSLVDEHEESMNSAAIPA